MRLKDLMSKGLPYGFLPLNRKERYFTGTVFPMIICRDNFKHFKLFTELLKCEHADISSDPEECNIQFFTEYSLTESVLDQADRDELSRCTTRKDTPDIIILITGNPKTLIAVEAKMFDRPTGLALTEQMENQKRILDYLGRRLDIQKKDIYHFALLPRQLRKKVDDFGYPVIEWQSLLEAYTKVCDRDYYLNILQIALARYGELHSRRGIGGRNCVRKMRGKAIYDIYHGGGGGDDTYKPKIMGRSQGLKRASDDVSSGQWEKHEYETSSKTKPPNKNWFTTKQFVDRVDKEGAKPKAG